jgi:hypothetical protein
MQNVPYVTVSVALNAEGKQIEDVATDILDYFLQHPDSADSLTGIARWRLLEQAVHRSVETTEDALVWLTTRGYLEEVDLQGVERVFRLNRTRRDDADTLVKSRGGAGKCPRIPDKAP